MYIPPFWCGVLLTVGFEIVVLIAWAVWWNVRNKKKGGDL